VSDSNKIDSTTIDGQPVTIIQASTVTSTTRGTLGAGDSTSTNGSSSKSSHAGIIGGVVAGVVSIIALVFLLYLCARRRKDNRETESIADKVTSAKHVDLTPETTTPLVTPFSTQSPSTSGSDSARGDGSTARMGGGSVYVAGDPRASPHPAPSESLYSSDYTDISSVVFSPQGRPSDSGHDAPTANDRGRSSWTPLLVFNAADVQGSAGGGGVRSGKGREARSRYVGGMGLATPLEGEEHGEDGLSQRSGDQESSQPSSPMSPLGPMIVHRDGGAVQSSYSEQKPVEIPPAYHSLST
jgi:hypothetical protein